MSSSSGSQNSSAAVNDANSSSKVVDLGASQRNSSNNEPPRSLWFRIKNAVVAMEGHLAGVFGLNESKYQWALDEFMEQQLAGELQARPPSPKALEEPQEMQPNNLQVMDRK